MQSALLTGTAHNSKVVAVRQLEKGVQASLKTMQRSQYNKEFLDYILEELMPWYSKPGMKDFLLLEVNQPINNIRGFTRETLSALLANIESREFRRMFANEHGIPQEHPRASTTDDVECFFSVLRDMVGKDFTHKQVMFGWRKVCEEFVKRMDPDLPFYYYTSNYQRFYEGDMPDFTVPAAKPREELRPARRELLGGNVGGRVSMIQRGAGSIRTTFHNVLVELPPPPGLPTQHILEHAHSFSH